MKAETYFRKHGYIYGISEKFDFGKWTGYAIKFTDYAKAVNWLHSEGYDFRIRSLVSKTEAKKYFKEDNECLDYLWML